MENHVHLTPAEIDLLLNGSLSPEAIRLGVRVLLAGCPVCMETVRHRVLWLGVRGSESRPESPTKPSS